MRAIRLAYRDHDRTPMIYCIKAMAERHYNVNVEIIRIEPKHEFEAALFNDSCDVIIEHIEYLHTEAAKGKKISLFCAPQIQRGLILVVPQEFNSLADLKGKTMAVRDLGRPHRITLWLRKVGLENDVRTIIVSDKEVGRWKQWKKVASGECAACFIAPIYLADALAAGLKTFPAEEAEVVSLFAQACLSEFAARNSDLLKDYIKAVIHALAQYKYRRDEAVAIAAQEPMRLIKLTDIGELRSQVDAMAELLQIKPYPTVEAIMNTNEIAAQEYGPTVENPLTLWDLHWVKELDDEGFIDTLVASLR
ncbi:MAG: ABC transporter substrate-binding protein [Deltaproteobacteria bacterium]|nr:ABC transporter substrate-binding protein [Deltaproteobacteria bacterium]